MFFSVLYSLLFGRMSSLRTIGAKVLLLGLMMAAAFPALGATECVHEAGFSSPELSGWEIPPEFARVESVDGTPAIRIDVKPESAAGQHLAIRKIDLKPYQNRQLYLEYEIKAENVSRPPQPWNGVKCMLHYKTPGKEVWASPGEVYGSFDWKTVLVPAFIPPGVETGTINLGLQDSSGTVWIRKMRILTEEPPFLLPAGFRAVYTDRVKKLPVHRGVMSPHVFRPEDMEELKSWGANLIRWQLTRNWGKANSERNLPEYLAWLRSRLDELDRVLDKCAELGIKVVIDLHTPPGGRYGDTNMAIFYETVFRDAFYAVWEEMAKRYRNHPAVWGYDLVNEPVQNRPAQTDYLSVQYEAAKRIRAIDPETPIIIESNHWCTPDSFHQLLPLPLPNIIYQVHMYAPSSYTHQGIGNKWGVQGAARLIAYPGTVDGRVYDREQLKNDLKPVRDFQTKYGVRIFVGEFSAVYYAPGAARYIDDLISIFEEYGWDWSYHAFRESHFWSVEYTGSAAKPVRAGFDTDRKKVLLKYFRLNGGE